MNQGMLNFGIKCSKWELEKFWRCELEVQAEARVWTTLGCEVKQTGSDWMLSHYAEIALRHLSVYGSMKDVDLCLTTSWSSGWEWPRIPGTGRPMANIGMFGPRGRNDLWDWHGLHLSGWEDSSIGSGGHLRKGSWWSLWERWHHSPGPTTEQIEGTPLHFNHGDPAGGRACETWSGGNGLPRPPGLGAKADLDQLRAPCLRQEEHPPKNVKLHTSRTMNKTGWKCCKCHGTMQWKGGKWQLQSLRMCCSERGSESSQRSIGQFFAGWQDRSCSKEAMFLT